MNITDISFKYIYYLEFITLTNTGKNAVKILYFYYAKLIYLTCMN